MEGKSPEPLLDMLLSRSCSFGKTWKYKERPGSDTAATHIIDKLALGVKNLVYRCVRFDPVVVKLWEHPVPQAMGIEAL